MRNSGRVRESTSERINREIDYERYALKLLRGDFSNVGPESSSGEILQDVRS